MDWAAANGHLDFIQWLHSNRSEGCTDDAMDKAAQNGHLDVIQWLHSNRSEGSVKFNFFFFNPTQIWPKDSVQKAREKTEQQREH